MSFLQALRYFTREACVNLVRGWKVSLLAVLTIATSLFLGGLFLGITHNLARWVGTWRHEARVVVYLEPAAAEAEVEALRALARGAEWATAVEEIGPEQAGERFREIFPSLGDLVEGWGQDPLPASLEIAYRAGNAGGPAFDTWLAALEASPAAAMVDDDRDWLDRLEGLVSLLRAAGLGLGAVLLVASAFTIASVVRLTAYLYRDEISVMRLVGATEFFIRGPFYMEGVLQGLLGGLLATGILWGAWRLLLEAAGPLTASLPPLRFLAPEQVALVICLGGLAGLGGAVASLHRETLKAAEE